MALLKKNIFKSRLQVVLAALVILLLAVFIFIIYKIATPKIDNSTYQLVKVESGESYVGKLTRIDSDYVELSDVFVYQEPKTPDQASSNGANTITPTEQGGITLLPVSSIKGKMYISRTQVTYWSNLANEGPVVNAIKTNKNQKN